MKCEQRAQFDRKLAKRAIATETIDKFIKKKQNYMKCNAKKGEKPSTRFNIASIFLLDS